MQLEGFGHYCWKGFGRDIDGKGWIQKLLLEGGFEGTSIGRVGSGGCCWKGGWKGRRLEGIEPDVVDRRVRSGRKLEGMDPDVLDGRVRSGP